MFNRIDGGRLSTSDFDHLPAGRYQYLSPDRAIEVVLDDSECEWWMEVKLDTSPSLIERVVDELLSPMGYELISEDEMVPDAVEPDRIRIWALPLIPIADDEPVIFAEAGCARPSALAGLAATVAAGALFSPLIDVLGVWPGAVA